MSNLQCRIFTSEIDIIEWDWNKFQPHLFINNCYNSCTSVSIWVSPFPKKFKVSNTRAFSLTPWRRSITLHTFLKMSLSVVQLVACSHTQPVIGWHNLSLPLIGWHSCLLSVSIPALPPAQASTLHMLSRILFVGATGTNLPSHFVQKIKSVPSSLEK